MEKFKEWFEENEKKLTTVLEWIGVVAFVLVFITVLVSAGGAILR
jgi:hypothetical protein